MNKELKLVYFNAKGLAETSRILLALARVDYDDYRFPLEIVDPVNHIYKRDEFDQAKSEGKFVHSMGKLPILEVLDKKGNVVTISQSKTIERYIAKRWGFMGSNDLESAKIDALCETVRDIRERYYKNKQNEEYLTIGIKEDLEMLTYLMDSENGFSVGSKLSLADVSIYTLTTQLDKIALDSVGTVSRIRHIVMKVASEPAIIVWCQRRPKTAF